MYTQLSARPAYGLMHGWLNRWLSNDYKTNPHQPSQDLEPRALRLWARQGKEILRTRTARRGSRVHRLRHCSRALGSGAGASCARKLALARRLAGRRPGGVRAQACGQIAVRPRGRRLRAPAARGLAASARGNLVRTVGACARARLLSLRAFYGPLVRECRCVPDVLQAARAVSIRRNGPGAFGPKRGGALGPNRSARGPTGGQWRSCTAGRRALHAGRVRVRS